MFVLCGSGKLNQLMMLVKDSYAVICFKQEKSTSIENLGGSVNVQAYLRIKKGFFLNRVKN